MHTTKDTRKVKKILPIRTDITHQILKRLWPYLPGHSFGKPNIISGSVSMVSFRFSMTSTFACDCTSTLSMRDSLLFVGWSTKGLTSWVSISASWSRSSGVWIFPALLTIHRSVRRIQSGMDLSQLLLLNRKSNFYQLIAFLLFLRLCEEASWDSNLHLALLRSCWSFLNMRHFS